MKKVYVGVSGGIDSAAALILLKEQGYEVFAIYLSMLSPKPSETTLNDLEQLSKYSGVDIEIYDASTLFDTEIIQPYLKDCLSGAMPSPCSICNPKIKWYLLCKIADQRGGGYVATGHYCRISKMDGHYYLRQGADLNKDQSYYLWSISEDVLKRAIFPLGELTKDDVRNFMCSRGWESIINKKQSMGVCFFNGKSFANWLESQGVNIAQGDVYIEESISTAPNKKKLTKVGTHKGFPYYTIAQKKGLTLFSDKYNHLSVTSIDTISNNIIIGEANSLTHKSFYLSDCKFISFKKAYESNILKVKVRGIGVNPTDYCKLELINNSEQNIKVSLNNSEAWALAKGQPAVFFINDTVIGGGIVSNF